MAKTKRRGAPVFRPIHCEMWADDAFSELDTYTKLTFIYLLTNSRTTPCGIYSLSMRQGAYETGLTQKQFEDSISKLVDRVRIGYAYDTNEVFIFNWLRYNGSNSPQWLKAVEDSLSFVKSNELRDLYNSSDRVSIPYAYGMYVVPNRERDRDRERDTSRGKKYPMPTVSSEVYDYASQIGLEHDDANAWFDYHEQNGWKKMKHTEKSVQASLRTWKRLRSNFQQAPVSPPFDEVLIWFMAQYGDAETADAEGLRFYSHYRSVGWRVNGQPVVDWKALAVKWKERP